MIVKTEGSCAALVSMYELTLSPVVGQMPPLARVAAMMAMLSHVISMEQHCR